MKTYKILSIVFIVTCVGLLVGLFTFLDLPGKQKIVFAACIGVVMALMVCNLVFINRKQKEQK